MESTEIKKENWGLTTHFSEILKGEVSQKIGVISKPQNACLSAATVRSFLDHSEMRSSKRKHYSCEDLKSGEFLLPPTPQSSLLYGVPESQIRKLEGVMNAKRPVSLLRT